MDAINLPYDRFPDHEREGVLFYNFVAKAEEFRGRCVLHTNAISLVMSGCKTMTFADREVRIRPEEFHMMSAGNCIARIDIDTARKFQSILIFFSDAALSEIFMKDPDLQGRKVDGERRSYLSFNKDPFVLNYIQSLALLLQPGEDFTVEMRQVKFEELMLYLFRKYPEQMLAFRGKSDVNFNDLQIREAVETNLYRNITLEELAFLCNLSLSTFKRRFLKIYGAAPSKWIMDRRIEQAKKLLIHHREKPGEVYPKVGYDNHSSFSKAFKKASGLTPRAFVERN